MDLIAAQIDDLTYLRLAYMTCKIANFILNVSAVGGGYWENLSI
jgi:hypothetical protein